MNSVTFNGSYYVTNVGQCEQNVRISYSESYSAATNKTTVTFGKCEIAASRMLTNCSVRGQVQFSGTTVQDYPLNSTSYQIYIGSGGVNSYVTVPGSGGGNITVTHSSAGTASFTIKLVAVESVLDAGVKHFGAAVGGHVYGIADGTSKTVSLTTRTSTLTVNPNGGTWNGSTSSQNFAQAPTSTKAIAAPTRTGYTFTGWTLTGGGSFSNTTYTYGASNGTLTARWQINTYTVSFNANGGEGAPDAVTKTYGVTLALPTTVPTRTGYSFLGWSADSSATTATYQPGGSYTANAAAVLYAVWRVLSFTLSATISDRGITANILRTASPIGGAASGLLANGDTIYYGDAVKVSWALSGGYQAETFQINGEDVSLLTEKTITVTERPIVILVVELGAMVYISNDMYQVFINDGTGWSQYQAFIGNGSSWEAY